MSGIFSLFAMIATARKVSRIVRGSRSGAASTPGAVKISRAIDEKTNPPILNAINSILGAKTDNDMTKQERDKTYNSSDYKSLTDKARTVFKNTCEVLDERGLFHVEDVPILAGYARNVVLARVAARDIERLGTVIEYMDRGYKMVKTNPAVDIMNKAQNAYEATALKLGLTPTGRKRLKGEGKAPKSKREIFEENV